MPFGLTMPILKQISLKLFRPKMKYGEIDRKRHVVYETVMLELFKIVLRVSMGFMIGLWHQLLLTLFAGSRLASTAQWGITKR